MKAASRFLLLGLALTFPFVSAACRKSPEPRAASRRSPSARSSAELRRYPFKGIVRQVDSARSQITVAHEEVPGYMPAMTMSFPVKDDPRVMALLRPGDRIEATLTVGTDEYWLEKLLTRGFVPTSPASSVADATVVTPQPNQAVGPGQLVPDFVLMDQTGKTLRLSALRGEPVAVTFLYTRCPIATACPMTTAKCSRLDRLLTEKHFGRLLTITVDPEHDTPEILADYAKKAGANPVRWTFLTGPPQAVARVAADFGVLYFPDHGQITHSLAAAVVDSEGRLATIYYGDTWQPEHLLRDLEKARGSEKVRKG